MSFADGDQTLEDRIGRIWDLARGFGLDPFPVHFEVVPATIMYEFGAYGLPGRFSHWTHGKAYHSMKTSYDYGLSKIYELVINTNPSYAFLLDTNTLLDDSFVAAHVLGHVDFFKHNAYFARTNRDMLETVQVDADRIRSYEFEYGAREVEEFLDAVLSIDEHVDPFRPVREDASDPGRRSGDRHGEQHGHQRGDGDRRGADRRGPSGRRDDKKRRAQTAWDDLFEAEEPAEGEEARKPGRRGVELPEKDLLWFLHQYAENLEDWQRDVIAIVRQEMLYFIPQMQTKIMNEGWASFWHNRIMRELDLSDKEFTDFAALHASVLAPNRKRVNPYHLGFKMWEDIEKRFGRDRLFEARELECDQSFLRNYLTEDLVQDLDLYVYALEGDEWKVTEKAWEKVRDTLVDSLTNFGQPYITVEDGNYGRKRELYLKHHFDGQALDVPYAERALAAVEKLWGFPAHLETELHGRKVVLTCEGGQVLKTMY